MFRDSAPGGAVAPHTPTGPTNPAGSLRPPNSAQGGEGKKGRPPRGRSRTPSRAQRPQPHRTVCVSDRDPPTPGHACPHPPARGIRTPGGAGEPAPPPRGGPFPTAPAAPALSGGSGRTTAAGRAARPGPNGHGSRAQAQRPRGSPPRRPPRTPPALTRLRSPPRRP